MSRLTVTLKTASAANSYHNEMIVQGRADFYLKATNRGPGQAIMRIGGSHIFLIQQ